MSTIMAALDNDRPLRPGFLAAPLGWLNEYLAKILTSEPELLATLFELTPHRMHVLGLGLAYLEPALASRTIIENLARRSPRTSLKQILGNWPPGLDRALHALLDTCVLAPESYQALVALLRDKATATHLHHRRVITEPLIIALAALPPPLRRPAIFKLLDEIDGVDRLVAGLRFLSDRTGIVFDRLIMELGSMDQPGQVRARITLLAERLPLPDRLPALQLGTFRRIDDPAQIRSLAKSWHNCLGKSVHDVDEGTSLIYQSTGDEQPVVALLARANRLGWAVVDIKGPKNADICSATASRHYDTFARADIPRLADIAAIRGLLWHRHFSRRR